MHANSLRIVADLKARHVTGKGSVLDVGSREAETGQGTYRPLWEGWTYTGVDIVTGRNVDRVVPADEPWRLGQKYDVVLCGQTLEHVWRPWELVHTLGLHVRRDGWLILVAPFSWPHHAYPIDCWRVAPDGMGELLRIAGCDVIETGLSKAKGENQTTWTNYVDCYGIGRRES